LAILASLLGFYMTLVVVKQIKAWRVDPRYLALGVATPDQLDVNDRIIVCLKILFDGHGYCLHVEELEGDFAHSSWHPELKNAEMTAQTYFGARSRHWELVSVA
jgi:hypothetical protein